MDWSAGRDLNEALERHLTLLYGAERAARLGDRLIAQLRQHQSIAPAPPPTAGPLDQRDIILITYADQVQSPGAPPLQDLEEFLRERLAGLVNGVHLLPFFPYSSDDGFSVIDYRRVNPEYGDWSQVGAIATHFRLMVDAVINHVSAQSDWFQAFVKGDPEYQDYFLSLDPATDLSAVVRPRELPLLTPVNSSSGEKHLWTTFSADQIDLNFANPQVLLEILDLLLFYVRQGAQIIRLDAIAFLWKEIGSACIHHPCTHEVVKLMRTVLESVAPWVLLITETNVPHEENLSYFGEGDDEAHLVYQFALPPLLLHALGAGDASWLSAWASGLALPAAQTGFFNFTASHDGVGLRPVSGILSEQQIQSMVELVQARGGGVSFRSSAGGGRLPYELNITYLDALTDPAEYDRSPELAVHRFLVSQAIMLALQGVPGIYFHSLFGSRNDQVGLAKTGRLRSINRQKLERSALEAELDQPGSMRNRVFSGYARLLQARRAHPAFHPVGGQQVLNLGAPLFGLIRTAPDQAGRVLALHELAGRGASCSPSFSPPPGAQPRDLLTDQPVDLQDLKMAPYQVRWIDLDGVADA